MARVLPVAMHIKFGSVAKNWFFDKPWEVAHHNYRMEDGKIVAVFDDMVRQSAADQRSGFTEEELAEIDEIHSQQM